jgi:hypothetical protein
MPRYFFNIVRGRIFIPDPEGDDLSADEEARQHAEMVAREMIEERHKYNSRSIERWGFIVTDSTGRHVATVPFSAQSEWAKPDIRLSKRVQSLIGALASSNRVTAKNKTRH